MAWIESHQSLLNHRKTLRAATLLKVDKIKLIGHLHALWWWALDSADNQGHLGDVTEDEIAEVALWPRRSASAFVTALLDCAGDKPGFLEHDSRGYVLHNWWKYAGKLNEKREKDRLRKTELPATSEGNPPEVVRKSQAPTNQPPPTNLTNQPTDLGGGGRPNLFVLIENQFGPGSITSQNRDDLLIFEQEHPQECIEHCFKAAALHVPRIKSFGWVKAMAERHRREGCDGKSSGTNSGQSAEAVDTQEALATLRRLGM